MVPKTYWDAVGRTLGAVCIVQGLSVKTSRHRNGVGKPDNKRPFVDCMHLRYHIGFLTHVARYWQGHSGQHQKAHCRTIRSTSASSVHAPKFA